MTDSSQATKVRANKARLVNRETFNYPWPGCNMQICSMVALGEHASHTVSSSWPSNSITSVLRHNSIASVRTRWPWQPTQPLTRPPRDFLLSILSLYIFWVPPHLSLMSYLLLLKFTSINGSRCWTQELLSHVNLSTWGPWVKHNRAVKDPIALRVQCG